jgi:hypothetical protein
MDNSNNCIKEIPFIINEKGKTIKIKKERKDRVVINEKKWILDENDYDIINQLEVLKNGDTNNKKYKLICSEIMKKISGYKNQDIKKSKYEAESFIDEKFIKEMLLKCELKCYYCREPVMVLYKSVREPKQWSVERINNDYGHNKNNVTIACLSCNLSRRTMYHERYRFTKQLIIEKKL